MPRQLPHARIDCCKQLVHRRAAVAPTVNTKTDDSVSDIAPGAKRTGELMKNSKPFNSLKPHEVSRHSMPTVGHARVARLSAGPCGLRPGKTSVGMAARIGSASGVVGRGLIKRAPPKHSSNTALRPGMLRCEQPNSLDLISGLLAMLRACAAFQSEVAMMLSNSLSNSALRRPYRASRQTYPFSPVRSR